jgi:uncharacterized protein YecT (DUF1311 family)
MRLPLSAILLCLAATLGSSTASAASFDCAKAKTLTEKAICKDPALNQLDERMAAAYKRALEAHGGQIANYVRNDQRAFLREMREIDKPGDIDPVCDAKDLPCLRKFVGRRIDTLESAAYSFSGVYKRADGAKLLLGGVKEQEVNVRSISGRPAKLMRTLDLAKKTVWDGTDAVTTTLGDSNGGPVKGGCELRLKLSSVSMEITQSGACEGRRLGGNYKRDLKDSLQAYELSID